MLLNNPYQRFQSFPLEWGRRLTILPILEWNHNHLFDRMSLPKESSFNYLLHDQTLKMGPKLEYLFHSSEPNVALKICKCLFLRNMVQMSRCGNAMIFRLHEYPLTMTNNMTRWQAITWCETESSLKARKLYPLLYKTCGIMSMPVLGSTIGRKHSSMIPRAMASFALHSAISAIFCVELNSWLHLRMVHEYPSPRQFRTPTRECRPK